MENFLEQVRAELRVSSRRTGLLHKADHHYSRSRRRGAGVVERGGLENRCGGDPTVGSNPTLSARTY
jgi:hypothetical protein